MKTRLLTMFVACTAAMFAFGEEGTERHWTGAAGNNDWTDPRNYDAAGVPNPAADDTLVFPDGAKVTLDGSDVASCNIAQHLYRMKVADDAGDVVITVNVPQGGTVDIDGAISPKGDAYGDESYDLLHVVKKGPGLLQLNSDWKVFGGSSSGTSNRYGTDYYAKFVVEEGTLRFPKNLSSADKHAMYVGYVAVSNGATVFTGNGTASVINHLYGAGIVTNDSSSACNLRLDIDGDFSGELNGSLAYYSRGGVMLRGTNSTMRWADFTIQYNKNGNLKGVAGLAKVGRAFEPSSMGFASNILSGAEGGKLLYLGTGERTDKTYKVTGGVTYRHVIDGGATGGLVWEGPWGQDDGGIGMVDLVLDGANPIPCEMEGPIYSYDKPDGGNLTFHISKQGTGTWHLHHNDETTMTGGFTVRDGTLRFDTIGETNVVSSLGKATNLALGYGAASWDETKVVPYAHTLGNLAKKTTGTLEYMGGTNCYSSTRATVISGTGVLKQSGAGALVMSGFSPIDSSGATLVLDGANTSTSNVAANVTDSGAGGVLSVVKRGAGTWTITENATFTGPLSVEEGTLILKPAETNYTWFRWIMLERGTDTSSGDATSTRQKVIGVSEFALYDSEGTRCNLNLFDRGVNSNESATGYQYIYRPYIDGGNWFGVGGRRYLQPGECSFETVCRTYTTSGHHSETSNSNGPYYPWQMFDGKASPFSGFATGGLAVESNPSTWIPVIMRLPEDSSPVKYWDYAHTDGARCQLRKSSLEGSVDGIHWEPICKYDRGDTLSPAGWEFKRVAIGSEAESKYGAPGQEIRGTTTNVWNFMTGNPVVSVNAGATLKAVGDVTLKNIKIDASAGAGTFDGFTFAADTHVEVANLTVGEACTVPVSFLNAKGLDALQNWTIALKSADGRTLRGRGVASASGIRYIPIGTRVTIR